MKRLAIAALAVLALGAVIAGAQVVTNPAIPPNTVCAYNTSPPTLTSGQASWLQCDSTGKLITSSGGGGSSAATIADGADVAEGSTTDAAVTQGGTGTVSAKLRLMTSQLNTIATTGHPITGTVAVTQSTSPWVTSATVSGTVASTQSGTWTVQPGNTANTTPWLVTGSGTAGTPASGVVTVQGAASMTKLLVTPDANSSVNVAQIAGTTAATGSGVMTAGTQRTALATDSPGIVTLGQTTKSASIPIAIASDQLGGATVANSLPIITSSQYPANATAAAVPITASATGTTAATTATLAGVSGKTTYLCGFSIRATATAAAVGNATVTGTITGTLNFTQFSQAASTGLVPLEPNLGSVCIPASATNTGIAVVSAAPGTGGVVSVTAWGYQL